MNTRVARYERHATGQELERSLRTNPWTWIFAILNPGWAWAALVLAHRYGCG